MMRHNGSWLHRLSGKLLLDVLPAALASALCGFVLTHYFGRAPDAAIAHAAPASAEMMQRLRDEHALVDNFVKAEVSKEKQRLAAEDAIPRVAVSRPLGEPPAAIVTGAVASTPAGKPTVSRTKAAIAGGTLPPLVIAQVQVDQDQPPAGQRPPSLFAKTIGFRDHVVAVTQRVVSAIGGLPSWIGAIGDRIGNGEGSRPPAELVSTS